jgi:lysozyme
MNPPRPPYLSGIDVSHFQGVIDWQRVKASRIGFAFIKATDGVNFVDPQLGNNVQGCVDAGIPFGLYHFFRPSLDATVQATFFLYETQRYSPSLPPALDLELGPVTVEQAAIWLDAVDSSLGREPFVYASPAFADEYLTDSSIAVYPIWIAEYTENPVPRVPFAWSVWEFWQHTPNGRVEGVPNAVDLDWFNGGSEELQTWIK